MRQDFALDRTIRFAGVIDKMSKISLQESMCKGRAEPLDPKEDRRKLYPEIALRNAMQQDFDPEYGRVSSIRCQSGRR